jgi:UDP-N-acetylglucosamine--N-acetylmuramyl-(pentapeptide) pyrophosphoryl-undecaprenol N-acetylglucosamine transferase
MSELSSPRLLMAASGTGGHVFPALAVAEYLPQWHIEWLGVPNRMEGQLIQDRYPLHTIPLSGFQSKNPLTWIQILWQLTKTISQVRALLRQGRFQCVFTTGGYIAAPVILAASGLGIPVILHESNAIPGKVTLWLGRWCRVVALGTARARQRLTQVKTQVVGTPVRSEFWTKREPDPDSPLSKIPPHVPMIAILGGSQGARGLNRLVIQCAPAWLEAGAWLVHLTGQTDAEEMERLAPDHPHYLRFPFWSDMAGLLQRATFAVSRSGSGTLAELAATLTPAILIPYPFAAEDHQYFNALTFTEIESGIILRETEPNAAAKLEALGLDWIQHPEDVAERGSRLEKLSVQTAAKTIATLLQETLIV